MKEFKRLVSYIYSYPGGVKDKNVGFAKAEVRNGIFGLSVNLMGVYRDTPEGFSIYLIFDRTKKQGTYNLLPVGSVIINGGKGRYQDIFNPDNVASSGYTFSQRESYQKMRSRMMSGECTILVVKDFSRFSRRNSLGLLELETLRDAGIRIISIGDGIDYPTKDDWMLIQFKFLMNEMPVTDTSRKIKQIIQSRQKDGK